MSNVMVHLPALMVTHGLCMSTSQARRDIQAGAVSIDDVPVEDFDVFADDLDGSLLRVGRRHTAVVWVDGLES